MKLSSSRAEGPAQETQRDQGQRRLAKEMKAH